MTRNNHITHALLYLLAFFASFTAFAAKAEIGVGMAVPLSGLYAKLGQEIVTGAQFAVDEWNAKQVSDDTKIILHTVDDKCNAERAKEVANQLIGKNVSFVIGHLCDRPSIETSPLYFSHKIIQISPGSQNPNFTDNRPSPEGGTYRLAARNTQQSDTLSEFVLSLKAAKVAVLDDRSVYGKGLSDNLQDDLEEAGLPPVLVDDFATGEESYRRLAGRISDSGADTIFLGAGHLDAAVLIRNLDALHLKVTIVAGDSLVHPDFPDLVLNGNENRASLDNIFVSFAPDPRLYPTASGVVERLRKANKKADGLTLRGYAALEIVAKVMTISKEKSFSGFINTLNQESFRTVLGRLSFDAEGDSHLIDYLMHRWKGNTIVPLPPLNPSDQE